jgi:hypothetical protein
LPGPRDSVDLPAPKPGEAQGTGAVLAYSNISRLKSANIV